MIRYRRYHSEVREPLKHPTACQSTGCDGRTEPGEKHCPPCLEAIAADKAYWDSVREVRDKFTDRRLW